MGIVKEFREFAVKGDVIDMAVGIIIGAAFGKIVSTLVNNVIMPPIGMLTGGIDFSDLRIVLQKGSEEVFGPDGTIVTPAVEEVAIGYGMFINEIITFTIVAFAVFMLVKAMMTAKKRFEKEQEAAPPPAPPADVVLLTEIRDLMKQNAG